MRLGTPYGYLAQQTARVDPVLERGHSGYFSAPQEGLDPHLFHGDRVLDNVRQFCVDTLLTYLNRKYHAAASWTTVWLAGSGISYQWDSDRGNGDLDVLFGIDWPTFYTKNRQYAGLSEDELVTIINNDLKENLWPKTANQNLNGQTYEVTFYVNSGASDIRNINPYAAYNLSDNTWTVRPTNNIANHFPQEFFEANDREIAQATDIIRRYKLQRLDNSVNGLARLNQTVSEAKTLFDDVHLGRRIAFGPGGSGYGDYYNFRWQRFKASGTIQALHEIAQAQSEARKQEEKAVYGAPIDDAKTALIKAALWNKQPKN